MRGLKELIVLLVAFTLAVSSCQESDVKTENTGLQLDSLYTMRTEDVDMLISEGGEVRYTLLSKEWLVYDDYKQTRRWVFPKGIKINTYDSIQEGRTIVQADTAIQYLDSEKWELIGSATIQGIDGELLASPHLFWDRKAKKIYSNDTVYYCKNGSVSRGTSFEAKDDLSDYTIIKGNGRERIEDNPNEHLSKKDTLVRADTISPVGVEMIKESN